MTESSIRLVHAGARQREVSGESTAPPDGVSSPMNSTLSLIIIICPPAIGERKKVRIRYQVSGNGGIETRMQIIWPDIQFLKSGLLMRCSTMLSRGYNLDIIQIRHATTILEY